MISYQDPPMLEMKEVYNDARDKFQEAVKFSIKETRLKTTLDFLICCNSWIGEIIDEINSAEIPAYDKAEYHFALKMYKYNIEKIWIPKVQKKLN